MILVLIVMALIIGLIVGGVTGFEIAGWVAGILFFIFGLPGALVGSFIHGEVSYSQDRADYRQTIADINADYRANEHEYAEDMRTELLLSDQSKKPTVINDNRQIHLHGGK